MERQDELKQKLQDLQKQLGKKQMFEEAVSSIRSLLHQFYLSASPSLRKSFFTVISRVATILKTRYTSPGFWNAGLGLFLEAEQLVSESSEKEHLRTCIARAREQLSEIDNQPEESAQNRRHQGYLFEGHLTVDQEPPQPQWLVQSNLMTALAATMSQAQTSQDGPNNLPQELMDRIHELMPDISHDPNDVPQEMIDRLMAMFPEGNSAAGAPPASKEVVAKLPVITITNEILAKLGPDAECAICKENLVVNDSMQEMPCKHTFHPPCLKPWLDEHNSCPICRHELRTDDHEYESRKERDKEAEEERKGAANAVRGGEYMQYDRLFPIDAYVASYLDYIASYLDNLILRGIQVGLIKADWSKVVKSGVAFFTWVSKIPPFPSFSKGTRLWAAGETRLQAFNRVRNGAWRLGIIHRQIRRRHCRLRERRRHCRQIVNGE